MLEGKNVINSQFGSIGMQHVVAKKGKSAKTTSEHTMLPSFPPTHIQLFPPIIPPSLSDLAKVETEGKMMDRDSKAKESLGEDVSGCLGCKKNIPPALFGDFF